MNDTHDTRDTHSIQKSVLDTIRQGKVRPRTRFYFLLRIIATAATGILVLLTSALAVSFILFSLHESGEQFLLGYGLQGVKAFLMLFPWLIMLFAIAFIILLEWLLRGFKFAYRIPLLYTFLSLLGSSAVLGVLITLTPLHATLLGISDKGELSFIGNAYEHIFDEHEDQGICRGTVVSASNSQFVLHHDDYDTDQDDGTSTVSVAPGRAQSLPLIGDRVFAFGRGKDGCKNLDHIDILRPSPRR